ncbi:hypothetical protein ACFL0D_03180 [Thermoproteota archaeon]
MVSEIIVVQAADSAILQVSTSEIYLTAGHENTITINLKNTGEFKLYDVEAFVTSEISGISVLSGAQMVYSEIDKGKTKSYEPVIYIDPSVGLGAYTLSLNVIYRRFGAEQDSHVTVPIGVVVDEGYVPKIRFTPKLESIKVQSGIENEVGFVFTNDWNQELVGLEFTLSSEFSSITIVDGLNLIIESLQPGEEVIMTPIISVIEGTPLSTYSIIATTSYKDEEGNRYHQTFSLPINVASAAAVRTTIVTIEDMKVVEDSIRPGDIFMIELTVKCSGADAYDLLSSLSFSATSPLSPISPSIISLGDLDSDQIIKATYMLLAAGDISAGQYPVTTTVSYTSNKGVSRVLTETLTILVDGLIDFELLDTPSDTVAPGETKELEADLLLIGTESVEFVSIGVVDDRVIKRVRGSDEYIGAVDPDSPIPFDVSYKVDEDAEEGNHELTLNVQYRDHLNREHEEQIRLEIDISEDINGEPTQQQGWIWVWIRRLLGLGP